MQFLAHLGGHKFLSEFNNDNNSCQNTEVLGSSPYNGVKSKNKKST